MVIDYCDTCFNHGTGNFALTNSFLVYTAYSVMHTRGHLNFMMIHPPSLLPHMSEERLKLLWERW